MNKRGRLTLVVSIVALIVLVILLFLYFALLKPANVKSSGITFIENPAQGLTTEEAIASFNESFVFYVLYSIKAYELHNPPLSNNDPEIEFRVDDDVYNAIIQNGIIKVAKRAIENPDAIIITTKMEGVKMVQNKDYIQESFASGKSGIDLKASKTTLFGKGYLNLYTELTGKSITGNIIRIYVG